MTTTKAASARKPPRGRKKKKVDPDSAPLERVLELIDQAVETRGKAVLADVEQSELIAALVTIANVKGETKTALARRVKRMNRSTRRLEPVTRQALDAMLFKAEHNASRRESQRARGHLNAEALS